MDPSDVKAMKKELLLKAKIALENKQYEEMHVFMRLIVNITDDTTDLSPEERSLLGAAFRNYLRFSQEAWRSAISFIQLHPNQSSIVSAFANRTEQQIFQASTNILNLIDSRLLPFAESKESKAFYLTLKGDFSWYLAELKGPIAGKGDADMASKAYIEAQMLLLKLDDQNSNCLALNLSLAEHAYWFLNAPEKACKYVDDALSKASSIPKQNASTSLLIFEGNIGLIEDLHYLKKKIEKSKNKGVS